MTDRFHKAEQIYCYYVMLYYVILCYVVTYYSHRSATLVKAGIKMKKKDFNDIVAHASK